MKNGMARRIRNGFRRGTMPAHIRIADVFWPAAIFLLSLLGGIALLSSHRYWAEVPAERAHPDDPAQPVAVASHETNSARRSAPSPTLESTPEVATSARLRPGDILQYRFQTEQTLTILQGNLTAVATDPSAPVAEVTVETIYAGDLELRVYGKTATGWVLGLGFNRFQAASRTGKRAPLVDNLVMRQAMTASEVIAVLSEQGHWVEFRFQEAVSGRGRNNWKAILAWLQVVLPANDRLNTWDAIERDATGVYQAVYHRAADNRDKLRKVKRRYRTLSDGRPADGLTVDGSTTIHLQDDIPSTIASDEFVWARHSEYVELISEQRAEFDLIRRFRRSFDANLTQSALSGAGRWEDMTPAVIPTSRAVASIPLDDTLALAAQLSTSSDPAPQARQAQILDQLSAAFAQDPNHVGQALGFLKSQSENPLLAALLFGAMSVAGTEVAQMGLEDVFGRETWPLAYRQSALMSLIQVEMPIERVEDTVRELHHGGGALAAKALLVLGTIGSKVRVAAPRRHVRLTDYILLAAGNESAELGDRILGLEAIGNLHLARTPERVLTAYTSAAPLERRSALRALRHIFDESANELLFQAVMVEPDEEVRLAAIESLAKGQRRGAWQKLEDVVKADPSERVRRRALALLARRVQRGEADVAVLNWVAVHDASKSIRETARQLLPK